MAQEQGQNATKPAESILTILLVEDDTNIGEVLVQAISQETPYAAVLAVDGFEALNIVKGIKPNLFILDYQLPYMNGIELYDKLHMIEGLSHIPALMMSARLPEKELTIRKIPGMHKPIDLDDFLQILERLLI